MKKLIFLFAVLVVSSMAITSCTEEEIQPKTELNGGGQTSEKLGR